MQIDWSTFLLETVNFLVLVWILKRFLYEPVTRVIEQRRAQIEAARDQASAARSEAQALRAQYEGRLADWERERQAARAELDRELDQHRARALESLREALEREREKARVQDERRQAERRRRTEERALALGARFAARLLDRLAGPELDQRILALLLEQIETLPGEQRAALRRAWPGANGAVAVVSARPLDAASRAELERGLRSLIGQEITAEYRVDEALGAGVRVSLGAWSLEANLQDELRAFADAARQPG